MPAVGRAGTAVTSRAYIAIGKPLHFPDARAPFKDHRDVSRYDSN